MNERTPKRMHNNRAQINFESELVANQDKWQQTMD